MSDDYEYVWRFNITGWKAILFVGIPWVVGVVRIGFAVASFIGGS